MINPIVEILFKIKAVQISADFNFKWSSGISSPIYCDNRKIISYPLYRDLVAQEFAHYIKKNFPQTQLIAATATAGIAHGAWVAQKLELPLVYIRAKAKAHGQTKKIEGDWQKGLKTILIEDLISTGGSSLNAYNSLAEEGLETLKVLSIVSYGAQIAKTNFQAQNLSYHALVQAYEILEYAQNQSLISESELKLIDQFLKNLK